MEKQVTEMAQRGRDFSIPRWDYKSTGNIPTVIFSIFQTSFGKKSSLPRPVMSHLTYSN